jgi:mycofactocin biosynthetic radical S-adenosylmethionine protein MftC
MSYSAYLAKTWDRHILSNVLLELTFRCNLDCFICYNDRQQQGRPLAKEDYFRLLEELAAMQVLNVIFSGGEPLLHPDFWAIGRHARELGFVVRVKSNGYALGPMSARRLKTEVDPFNVDISLHGACAATHERQTRVPGSFVRLLENLRTMKDLGIRIKLNCPLTAWNEGEIEEMFALADGLALQLSVNGRLTPCDDGDTRPLDILPSVEGTRAALRLQKAHAKARGETRARPQPEAESRHHCGAGASTLTVDPFGNIYPCVQWRRAIGNVRTDRIQALWDGSGELQRIRAVTEQVKKLFQRRPDGGRSLGFCPALAEQRTGSPFLLDPEVRKRLQAQETEPDDPQPFPSFRQSLGRNPDPRQTRVCG